MKVNLLFAPQLPRIFCIPSLDLCYAIIPAFVERCFLVLDSGWVDLVDLIVQIPPYRVDFLEAHVR